MANNLISQRGASLPDLLPAKQPVTKIERQVSNQTEKGLIRALDSTARPILNQLNVVKKGPFGGNLSFGSGERMFEWPNKESFFQFTNKSYVTWIGFLEGDALRCLQWGYDNGKSSPPVATLDKVDR